MRILALDDIQLAMPPGRENDARAFHSGLLDLSERRKPDNLIGRGGCWFERGEVRVHLGVQADFRPATKAHPAFVVDGLADLVEALKAAEYTIIEDRPLVGYGRCYVADPFGNRIELLQRRATA